MQIKFENFKVYPNASRWVSKFTSRKDKNNGVKIFQIGPIGAELLAVKRNSSLKNQFSKNYNKKTI